MTILPITICLVCYITIGIGNYRQGDYPHAMMWWAYALSQLALLWYELQKGYQNV